MAHHGSQLSGNAFPLALTSWLLHRLGFLLMENFKSKSCLTLTVVWGLLVVSPAGWSTPLADLVQNSPFAPPTGAPAPTANNALEFRGVFADGGDFFFSIHDPTARTSHWVGLNEPGLPYTVRSYDAAKQTVVTDFQGRSLELVLKKAPIVASPGPIPNLSAETPPPPALAPTTNPPEEAARLAAIAAEIRRRRELRQKPAAMDPPAGTQP